MDTATATVAPTIGLLPILTKFVKLVYIIPKRSEKPHFLNNNDMAQGLMHLLKTNQY